MTERPERTGEPLPSEAATPALLPAQLGTRDLIVLFVAVVLFISNAAVIQGAGPAAFAWWVLGFALFLVPTAVAAGQLGRMFPGEGSVYLWTHRVFGHFWGFLAGFCAWWPGVLVMVATGTLVLAFLGDAAPGLLGDLDVRVQGVVIALIVAGSAVLATRSLRATLRLVTGVMVAYGVAVAVIGLAGVAWLVGGNAAETDPLDLAAYAPAAASGVNLGNWGFFGLAVLALLGAEVPLNLGAEVRDRAAVTRYLTIGSAAVILAYLVGTFGVMVVVPADGASLEPTAVATAAARVFGDVAGAAVDVILVATFLAVTVVYNVAFSRLLFVFGLDGQGPAALGRVNAAPSPSTAVWAQSVLAIAFALGAFVLVPTLGLGGGTAEEIETRVYEVLQAAVTVVWCISVVILFLVLLRATRRHPERYAATRIAHRRVLDVAAIVGIAASLVGIASTLSGSWTPLIPNDAGTIDVLGASVAFGAWTWWVGGLAILSLLVAAGWYAIGRRRV